MTTNRVGTKLIGEIAADPTVAQTLTADERAALKVMIKQIRPNVRPTSTYARAMDTVLKAI